MPAPDSAMVCIISAASVTPSPAPPWSCGIATPSQPASREGAVEIIREPALAVPGEPVVIAETRANLCDRVADGLLFRRE